jgi:hypothetical protein
MKPSDHYRAGECGFCHGEGSVTVLVPLPAHSEVCPACQGTGSWPPDWDPERYRRRRRRRLTQFGEAVLILCLGVAIFLATLIGDHPLVVILGVTLVIIGVLTLLVTWLL